MNRGLTLAVLAGQIVRGDDGGGRDVARLCVDLNSFHCIAPW